MPAKSRAIKSNLKKVDRHRVTAKEYAEAPELTAEQLASATLRRGDKIVRRGRPTIGVAAKQPVTMRLDRDILIAYRATGPGWQARINADLHKAAKRLKA